MLSLFPSLFSYPLFAYLMLRLIVAWGIFRVGVMRWKQPDAAPVASMRSVAFLEFVAGILVLIGLYTQGALIATVVLLIVDYIINMRAGRVTTSERTLSIIIALIAFSLLFTGPGAFAFDLPL